MLDRRLHVLLDDDRFERLSRLANERSVSVGALVRRAIDVAYPPGGARRSAAAAAILEARPGPSPMLDELRTELDDLRGRGLPEGGPAPRRSRRSAG
ncbi:MAG TPA: hypothetical protein VE395_00715 [Acidimicrobiales bacterium]|nr:hypothetical protein [Acidimicrobiales bacterium]